MLQRIFQNLFIKTGFYIVIFYLKNLLDIKNLLISRPKTKKQNQSKKRIITTLMRKIALHYKIGIGMLLGIVLSFIVLNIEGGKSFIIDWVKPFGTIFIKALKLIAVPLIFASLIKGVSDLKNLSQLSKIGGKTIALYLSTTIIAVIIGLTVVNLIQPGNYISEKTRSELLSGYTSEVDSKIALAKEKAGEGPLQALVDVVPDNIFLASGDNANMLQIIFFALFMGISMILIPQEKTKPVKDFFDSLNDIILKMIDLIMYCSPYGVFALMASLVAEAPNADLFKALIMYTCTFIIALLLMVTLYLLILKIYTDRSPRFFISGISPAQLLAFSTSSSAATLPVTTERTQNYLGVDKEITSFVLPIGATINMDGASIYHAVSAVFIAQAFGMDLSTMTQIGIIITATLASIGSASVPGAAIVMLVIVLAQAGIPEAGLSLIFAIDRPLDMLRTTVNITGDATVAMLVAKSENKLEEPIRTLNTHKL